MPDLGIGEALAAFGGTDLLSGLFGTGAAAAETGAATIGADALGAAATGTGLADIVGTGTGLATGATGLEGTLLGAGVSGADIASGAALGTTGLGALGTATDFLAAPGASAFNPAALTPGIGGPGSGPGVLTPSVSANLTPSGVSGTSVFDTGASGVPGVNASGAPAASPSLTPPGASAASIAAPSGVTSPVDATAAASGAPAASGTPAASSTSISDLLSKGISGVEKSLTSNPLGVGLGAAGLGYNIWNGQKQTANQKELSADAATATQNSNSMVASGEALQQYLTNGTLPAAYQSQVDQAIASAKTKAISNAAAQGQPTDPTQNTSLAATLAGIDNQRGAMQSQVASQLFSSGSSLVSAGQGAAGLSGQLYSTLVNNDTAAAKNTGAAIASLAAALNGKSQATVGGTNINVSAA